MKNGIYAQVSQRETDFSTAIYAQVSNGESLDLSDLQVRPLAEC